MRKSVDLIIEYRRDGIDSFKTVTVDFIPNSVLRLYYKISEVIQSVSKDSLRISELRTKLDNTSDTKEQKSLLEKIKLLSTRIENVSKSDFFEKRFELIKKILVHNKCTDEDLLNAEFWDDYIEPSEMTSFINSAVSKDDTDSKKKALKKKLSTKIA